MFDSAAPRRRPVRRTMSPFGAWVMQSRPISEPSSPCTSKPVGRISGGEGVVELRQHAAGEAHDAHGAILEPFAAHAAVRSHGADRYRFVVEHEAKRIGVVNSDVQDDSAACVGPVDTPALQIRRQVDGMEHAREQRLADPALLDRLTHRPMCGGVAQVVVGAHDNAALAAFGDHRARVGKRQRQRLFAQHMLAGRAAARAWSWCSSLVVEM